MLLNTLTIFAAEKEQSGILGLELEAFIVQLVTLLLALLVLQKFAVKPILQKLEQRRELIEKGVTLGEKMEKEKAQLENRREQILSEARERSDEILSEAHVEAREINRQAEDDAHKKTEAIFAQADEQIKQDTARARKKLEEEMAVLVAEATEAILEEKVDASKDASMIEKALKRSKA